MIRPDFQEIKQQNELYHYGTKGKSGRYPLGSGERPYQDYPGMRKRKPGRLALMKLNSLNTKKEAWETDRAIINRQRSAAHERYPTLTKKLVERNERIFNYQIESNKIKLDKYTKKFDEQMKKFEDAGIDLDKKIVPKVQQIRSSQLLFSGNKYYIKKDKKR